MSADERATLDGWLDFYRATLESKCAGLTASQLREAACPPSTLTLLGLVQHLSEVERNWFRRVLAGERVDAIYPTATDGGHDDGFTVDADATLAEALELWRAEIAAGRANSAARDLGHTSPFRGREVSLRWIYGHMIAEYARHCGHADLLRERIDGATGI